MRVPLWTKHSTGGVSADPLFVSLPTAVSLRAVVHTALWLQVWSGPFRSVSGAAELETRAITPNVVPGDWPTDLL